MTPTQLELDTIILTAPLAESRFFEADLQATAVQKSLEALGVPTFFAAPIADWITDPTNWPLGLPRPFDMMMKQMLAQVGKPIFLMQFYTTGSCGDPSAIQIENIHGVLQGAAGGSLTVASIGLDLQMSANPATTMRPGPHLKLPCPNGGSGTIIERRFYTLINFVVKTNPGGVISLFPIQLVQPVRVECCSEKKKEAELEEGKGKKAAGG